MNPWWALSQQAVALLENAIYFVGSRLLGPFLYQAFQDRARGSRGKRFLESVH
jgi:hypothetical protein